MFGTCSLALKGKIKIDFTTARREAYERPAALPKVEPSSLKDDLARRDFTINAMAVSLNREDFGRLIDFFGGRKDLAVGIIRVMHDKSFIDDPTRIFRAVRFENRFGFAIDRRTYKLIESAINKGMLGRLSGYRIKKELLLTSRERNAHKIAERMEGFRAGNLKAIEL
jgi:tRNA nucleotidyltransferase (CCA-adding enzyme)